MAMWNLWHGCTKISAGCQNCYMFRRDEEFGKNSSLLKKTSSFDLPIRRKKDGSYQLVSEDDFVYTCFTSDFFHESADEWRHEAWKMIDIRRDLRFFIVTKRPERFYASLPENWGDGYENVHICCTCENQETTDFRLPFFLELPIKHKSIIHEPMLEGINIEPYLAMYGKNIDRVTCGGESGDRARICDYDWVLWTKEQCERYNVPFSFKQTGASFRKNGHIYSIPRAEQHTQAKKAAIDYERK